MSVLKSFAAVGVGPELFVAHAASFTYDVSGTFVGTVLLQQADRGGWLTLATVTGVASGTVVVDARNKARARVRFLCTARASGTIVTSLTAVVVPVDLVADSLAVGNLTVSGDLIAPGLPTEDPAETAGQVYNDSAVLKVSEGA